jgi:L-seryl-tRNA(Ser) seleniumtransferase
VKDGFSEAGSGSLPEETLPTKVITIRHDAKEPEDIFRFFLDSTPPILGRIKDDSFLLDMRMIYAPQSVVPCA